MKFLAFILSAILSVSAVAAPPMGLAGQEQGKKYPAVIKTPNKQVTDLGAASVLLETGNKNILENPSFEHSTVATGWTCSPSGAAETSVVIDGKQSLKVSPSAATLECYQDSTLYAAQFADGVQGVVSVRVKTAVSGLKVCSRNAAATSTSLCVDVTANDKWGHYKIPVVLGATSNGISIHSDGASVTGDVYIDDAFVGAQDVTEQAPLISEWEDYDPAIVGMGTTTNEDFKWRQVGDSVEIHGKFTSGTTTAVEVQIPLPSGYTIDSTKMPTVKMVGVIESDAIHTSNWYYMLATGGDSYLNVGRRSSGTNSHTPTAGTGLTTSADYSFFATVPVTNLSSAINTYTAQCNSDIECANEFGATVSSTGVVSGENLDWISGDCTNAHPRVCTINSGVFSETPNCSISARGASAIAGINALSSTSLSIATYADTGANTNTIVSITCQRGEGDYQARRQIVGSFKEMVKTPGVTRPVLYSALVTDGASTTTVSREMGDFVNGNCTNAAAGQYVCPFNSVFAEIPNCWCQSHEVDDDFDCDARTETTSQVSILTNIETTGTPADADFKLFCHGEAAP